MIKILVDRENFDCGKEALALSALKGGAIASFIGLVRGDHDVVALELEHYPVMTEKALQSIAQTADNRWSLHGITIIHRIGKLTLGEQIVLVCTCSDHRHAALESCAYIMDRLKTDAPFWKKQWREDGTGDWVEEQKSDHDANDKWKSE